MVNVFWWIWGHDPIGNLGFWFEVGRGITPAQISNHGRGHHHGLAVVVSGNGNMVSRGQPWPPPRFGRGCLWKFGFVYKYHTTVVAFTTGWPWLALELHTTGVVTTTPWPWLSLFINCWVSVFLNRGRGYHHTLAVVDSVCVIMVHMPRVLIPYARFRIKDDLAL